MIAPTLPVPEFNPTKLKVRQRIVYNENVGYIQAIGENIRVRWFPDGSIYSYTKKFAEKNFVVVPVEIRKVRS